MTKKDYIFYILALFLSVILGIVLILVVLLVEIHEIFNGTVFYLPLVLVAFLTRGFVKKVVLLKKYVFLSLLMWNVLVLLFSVGTISVIFGDFGSEGFLIALPYFIIPCLVVTLGVARMYNSDSGLVNKWNAFSEPKRSVVENICICFTPAILIFAYYVIISAITKDDFSAFLGGIQYPVFLSMVMWSFDYGSKKVNLTRRSGIFSIICNLSCSVLATALLYILHLIFSIRIFGAVAHFVSWSGYYRYFIEEGNFLWLIVMAVIPVISLCLGALLAKYTGKKKISE